jgi:hypothetical protein
MRINNLPPLIALAMILQISSAYAMNKCTDADGKISYQDAACPVRGEKIVVVPANRSTDAAPALNKSTTKQRAELDSYHAKQEKEAKEQEIADKKRDAECQTARQALVRRRARLASTDNTIIAADVEIQIQRERMKDLGCSGVP